MSKHTVRDRKPRMSKLKTSFWETGKRRVMFFSKSLTMGDEELGKAASAADYPTVFDEAQERFIDRLRNGDADAFDTLANRYAGDIYGLLYRITQDAEEASDLTQETFLSALRAISKFRGDADLKTWLFRIAINESRNRFRWWKRRRRDVTISLDVPVGESETMLGETFSSVGPSPEENALSNERGRLLRTALDELAPIFREAIILCDIEGLTYDEIARTLEINIGTVKSRIARGREELRRKLEGI